MNDSTLNVSNVRYPLMVSGALIFIYLLIRAVRLPMTCDEVQTCLAFSRYSVPEIMTYSRSAIPNNHIFHTLLVKLFTNIFGMKLLVTRLPNLLGFITYYYFCCRLVLEFTSKPVEGLSKFGYWASVIIPMLILVANPYLLDFFSLARGYGLACGLMMGSVYYALCYCEESSQRFLFLSLLLGALAVYANLTVLNYFVALWVLLLMSIGYSTLALREDRKMGTSRIDYTYREMWIHFGMTVGIGLVLAAALYLPIVRMRETNQFVFWGSKGFYQDTFVTLVNGLAYHGDYFHADPTPYICGLILVLLFVCVCFAGVLFGQYRLGSLYLPPMFMFGLLFGSIVVNILQHWLVGTLYLQTRTALFFFPLGALVISQLIGTLMGSGARIVTIPCYVIGMAVFLHLVFSMNLKSCWEWWYDMDTREVLNYLEDQYKQDPQKKKIKLATNDLMQPSFWFHVSEEGREPWVNIPAWDNHVQKDSTIDYYYTFASEYGELKGEYDMVKDYGGRFLLRRRR